MEKSKIGMIVHKKLESYLKQTKILFGEELYLKNKNKTRNIDLIIVTEYPNYNHLTSKVYSLKYEKLLKKIIKSIGMQINHDTLIFPILEHAPEFSRSPLEKEVEEFKTKLKLCIRLNRPNMIIGFGKTVGKSLIGESIPFEEMRCTNYQFEEIPIKITYDPFSILNNADYKRPLWIDLKLIRDYLSSKNIDE